MRINESIVLVLFLVLAISCQSNRQGDHRKLSEEICTCAEEIIELNRELRTKNQETDPMGMLELMKRAQVMHGSVMECCRSRMVMTNNADGLLLEEMLLETCEHMPAALRSEIIELANE